MYTVIISHDAFRTVVSSALEAYTVPHGRRRNIEAHSPLETYGTSWGYSAKRDDMTVFNVVAADVDSSAHRTSGWVRRKAEAFQIKSEFYKKYFPELEYLGDFHSHPYSQEEDDLKSARELESQHLYRFSSIENESDDFDSVLSLKMEGKLNYQVGLVTTIYRMSNVVNNPLHSHLDKGSAIRFTYNGVDADGYEKSFRCWLKAYVFPEHTSKPAKDKDVRLLCPSLGFYR